MQESVTISLKGIKTSLSQDFFPPIQVYEDSEIALLCLQTYNTFPNINETNNKMTILLDNNGLFPNNNTLDIVVEPGCYEVEDIKNKIMVIINKYNNLQTKSDDKIVFDLWVQTTDFRCYLKCNREIVFNEKANLGLVLGFTDKRLKLNHPVNRSEKAVDINPVNSIKVLCNIAKGSFDNGKQGHSIYEFFPDCKTGAKVVQSPSNLIYYTLNTSTIDSIQIDLVDQENKQIHNFNEKLTVVLHIRRYGS